MVSMPVLTALMIAWRPSIFSCGESLLFSASALAVSGPSSLSVDMVMLLDDGWRRGETPPSEVCIYAYMRWEVLGGVLESSDGGCDIMARLLPRRPVDRPRARCHLNW